MLLGNQYQKTTMNQQNTQQIETRVINENLGLINSLLRHYRGAVDEFLMEDLKQIALMTLITELRKFDHIDNDDFKRSTIVRIRGAVIDELRRRDYMSRDKRQLLNQIKKTETALMHKLGREATERDICEAMNITSSVYQETLGQECVFDDIEFCDVADEFDASEQGRLQDEIEQGLNEMPDDQQKVMYLMYVMGLSTQETAMSLDLNEIKVHRLKHKGIESLKTRLQVH